jgi:pimeloyl-ACP methyl ester carboxylesterase
MPIEPYSISFSQPAVEDLQDRLQRTRWTEFISEQDSRYGLPVTFLKDLCLYWQHTFSWENQVEALREQHHFLFEQRGVRIHFRRERGVGPNPLPLILTHGWPGSFLEMEKIVPMLTDPASFGGDPEDAFDVIVPSLPGFGFSRSYPASALNAFEVADVWASLMAELGYAVFAAQGGDIGAGVTTALGLRHPERILGIHLNYIPGSYKPFVSKTAPLTETELRFLKDQERWVWENGAYALMHKTRPYTAAYGLNDSPIGLAAWILEKFRDWSDCNGDVCSRFTQDELLRNVTLYWMTETIGSSMLMYAESARQPFAFGEHDFVQAPCAVAAFPREILTPPRSYVERGYNLQRWTTFASGGHFAAAEEPGLLAGDLRAFFRPYRA